MDHSSAGDPQGRRLARRRAAQLSEAGRLLDVASVLLGEAAFGGTEIATIAESVARAEQAELQRSLGRIESRRRFKYRSGHPLTEARACNQLFIDECGRSHPEPGQSGQVFALAGVAMDDEHIADYCRRADELKLRFFDTTRLTLHEPMMRQFDGQYFFGGDQKRQAEFDEAVEGLLLDTPFTLFGAAVRKTAFARQFVSAGIDPYLPTDVYTLAITLLLERYVDFVAMADTPRLGRITFESQGPKEDAQHQIEYARLLLHGTQWVPAAAFQQTIEPGGRFVPKAGSHPVEIADMFSRTLWEWVRDGCVGQPKRWATFSRRIYCRDTRLMGTFGVKVFPDSDIRDRIEEHRQSAGP